MKRDFSIEQKIVEHLSKLGFLTNVGDVTEALRSQPYAEWLITGDGLSDEIEDEYGNIGDCDCEVPESLTNEEIQEVFDNDYK